MATLEGNIRGAPGPPGPPGPAGTDEVFVGPSDPGTGAGYELWYDTTATIMKVQVAGAWIRLGGSIEAGTIAQTVRTTPPVGWLFLDGSTIVNAQAFYIDLWNAAPTAWKVGADLVFPDGRGRALVGAGAGAGLTPRPLGALIAGEETHLLTAAESGMPAHTPSVNSMGTESADHAHYVSGNTGYVSNDHTHTSNVGDIIRNVGGGFFVQNTAGGYNYNPVAIGTGGISANHYHTFAAWTGGRNAGHTHAVYMNAVPAVNASAAHNNMQPSIAFNTMIKT